MAADSFTLSSSAAAVIETYNSLNFYNTLSKDSFEKVEATYTKAMMGLFPPILFNSDITVIGLLFGSIDDNFSIIKSKASFTSTD